MADLWARIWAKKAALLRDLDPQYMMNELLQHGVLDDDEHDKVKRGCKTRRERAEALLDILKGKGPEELRGFVHQLGRFYHHLAEEILTAGIEEVQRAIPTPRNCRLESSTRDSLTVAWDQLDAIPGGSVEVAIFAHGNDQEPVQHQEVGCDQTVVRTDGLRAGTKYDARVRVVSGELRGPQVVIEAKTASLWASIPWKYILVSILVAVVAVLVIYIVWMKSTGERCLYPKYILKDAVMKTRPHLFGREEDIANLTIILEKNSVCLVSGLSGVGKTALVKEYMYRNSHNYTAGIIWITSYNQTNFLFVNVLRKVEGRDPIVYDYRDKNFEWMAEYLSKTLLVKYRGKFLFVFDNVETSQHAADMLKIVPDKSAYAVSSHMILLSRRELSLPHLEKLPMLKLHPLSEEAAIQLYKSQNKSDMGWAETDYLFQSLSARIFNWDLQDIVHGLGYLPHAIIHYYKEAEVMHLEHGVPYSAYNSSALLSSSELRLDLTGYGQSENPIVHEVRKVQKECPKAYELLVLLSFFNHREPVPLCVVKGKGMSWEHSTFKGESYYMMAECLKKHSLIKFDNGPCEITLNRIVTYAVMYTVDSVESAERYFWTALEIVVRAVERLRQLVLKCSHNYDSLDCKGYTKKQLAEVFFQILGHSHSVAFNAIDGGSSICKYHRSYAMSVGYSGLRQSRFKSVRFTNPVLNISSWPVNLTKRSCNNELMYEYEWPITPMESYDDD